MSSFIGCFGSGSSIRKRLSSLVRSPSCLIENDQVLILGESKGVDTFHSDQKSNWMAAGIGISGGDSMQILDDSDWNNLIGNNAGSIKNLNGHFALVFCKGNEVNLFTDQLGLRSIFIHLNGQQVIFSTRLDWLLKLAAGVSIDWGKFGSTWLASNPFTGRSFIRGITRISQGGHAILSAEQTRISQIKWSPASVVNPDIAAVLNSICEAPAHRFKEVSLGLSGGLDSRVLLAVLSGQERFIWDSYTFSNGNIPDIEIAVRLTKLIGARHQLVESGNPTADQVLSVIPEFTARTLLTASLFDVLPVQNFEALGKQGKYTIDGAFGEIGRRRFLKSVELKASRAILNSSSEDLLPYFKAVKADIFSEEITSRLRQGMREDFEHIVATMPDAKETGTGNWLDLFTLRTRVPNLVGARQEFSDERVFHFMPYLQSVFLNAIFGIEEKERSNAVLFRKIIQQKAPELTRVPLVKGNDVYPYWMRDLPAMAWMKVKRKLGIGYKENRQEKIMVLLEEAVKDIMASQSVRENPIYNQGKIKRLLSGFYDQEKRSLASQVGWLLSFELFRGLLK